MYILAILASIRGSLIHFNIEHNLPYFNRLCKNVNLNSWDFTYPDINEIEITILVQFFNADLILF